MRILVVASNIKIPDSHGGSTHVGELIRNLRTHGPTHLLGAAGSEGEEITGVGTWKGHPPTPLKHLVTLSYLPRALAAARAFKPDVIYERGSAYGLGALLSLRLGIPMLCMVLDEHYSPLSLSRASRIIATNPELVPGWARSKAVKVSWGANAEMFHPELDMAAARAELGVAPEEFVVGYTGSFQAWHGLDVLVEAARHLGDRPVRFLLVGDGRRREEIEGRIQDAGLTDRFIFTGRVSYEAVPGLLSASDVCVAPFDPALHPLSRRRGFALDPLKVFEYLAMGKPTITIRAGNIEALFTGGEHLSLVTPGDPQELADAIVWTMDHPEEAAAAAELGRERVLAHHTWAAHAAHLATLFGEMRESM
ncbi:MAG: glycosyltransferase [Myxococcota bacterium]|nr:glycosyltransferase [Myxococcota bacterium]